MVLKKSRLKEDLARATREILDRMLKLYIVTDHDARNVRSDWKYEIFNLLHDIARLKKNHEFPTSEQIYKWTYGSFRSLIRNLQYSTRWVKSIRYAFDVDLDEEDVSENSIFQFDIICEDYFCWLAIELSQYGRVSEDCVNKKLNELSLF